jgi:hypothetical protein
MGTGNISKHFHWSKEDLEEHDRIKSLQEMALSFVTRSVFYGVPVRSQRKSYSPNCPLWIEPIPEAVEQSLMAKASGEKVGVVGVGCIDCLTTVSR